MQGLFYPNNVLYVGFFSSNISSFLTDDNKIMFLIFHDGFIYNIIYANFNKFCGGGGGLVCCRHGPSTCSYWLHVLVGWVSTWQEPIESSSSILTGTLAQTCRLESEHGALVRHGRSPSTGFSLLARLRRKSTTGKRDRSWGWGMGDGKKRVPCSCAM